MCTSVSPAPHNPGNLVSGGNVDCGAEEWVPLGTRGVNPGAALSLGSRQHASSGKHRALSRVSSDHVAVLVWGGIIVFSLSKTWGQRLSGLATRVQSFQLNVFGLNDGRSLFDVEKGALVGPPPLLHSNDMWLVPFQEELLGLGRPTS